MSTRKRSDGDFDDEIGAHIEAETDRLVADGMDPDAARFAALRAFGNVTRARERFHERGRLRWLDHLVQDVRCALRSLRRYPIATVVALVSLAAGIGATAVTLSVRDVIFYKFPATYRQPEQLSRVQVGRPDQTIRRRGSAVPGELFARWRGSLGSPVGGTIPLGQRELRAGSSLITVPVRAVTPDLFAILGVQPILGAGFPVASTSHADVSPVVLSHRVWEQAFERRPDVVGEPVWIENQPYVVAGVMPERFWVSDMDSPVWTVLDPSRIASDQSIDTIVRRASGVAPSTLEAQLKPELDAFASTQPEGRRQLVVMVSGMEGTPLGDQVSIVLPYLLGVCVLLTLLIACANVAVLMIAQWTVREHEIAIRASLGASRSRIVRSLLTESVLIACLGGAAGMWTTYALHSWILTRIGGASPFDLTIDVRIFVQSAAIALLTGFAAGLAPALYETRRLQDNPLRAMSSADRVRQRWRHALVVFEIAVTVALLVVTSAMIDGYLRASRADMGFSTHTLLTARVENAAGVSPSRATDAVNNLSGVAAVAAASSVPFSGGSPEMRISTNTDATGIAAERVAIFGPFLEVLGVPLRAGRGFTHEDGLARTAIINAALERRLFPAGGLGETVWMDRVPYDVIGVAADYSSNPFRDADAEPRIFVPMAETGGAMRRLHVLIRSAGEPAALVQTVRKAIRASVAGNVVTGAGTLDQIIEVVGQEMLVGTAPLFPLISIGMLLTMAGIYGVLAFAIARRARELAVRVAIGANPRDLAWLVARQTMRLVGTGAAIGVLLTFGLSRVVRASGGAGSIYDPSLHAFMIPVAVLVAIGAIATWIPARRATSIDPVVLLRTI